jgi:hypothetical protein
MVKTVPQLHVILDEMVKPVPQPHVILDEMVKTVPQLLEIHNHFLCI